MYMRNYNMHVTNTLTSMSPKPYLACMLSELEKAVGHQPFSNHLAEQIQGQIYYAYSMGKPMIVYKSVPTFSEWPINF